MRKVFFPCSRSALRHVRQLTTQEHQEPQQWFKPKIGQDTGIRIYNCAARRLVPLILPNENYVTWYTCGPTVYDAAHLGHASCYVKLDIIQRIIREYCNVNLVTAMNITDIDDKIIMKAEESGKDWRDIARSNEAQFWSDMKSLNVIEPNLKIRVTENVPLIIDFIQNIIEKGYAYVGNDNSVYFHVKKYPIYGKLQPLNLEEVPEASQELKSASADFALWKARKRSEEPSWSSPWGIGRPGWHIECSAMASMLFGSSIDFHAGGLDLKFPHHENEDAQSCVYHNTRQWINYWLHTGHLNIKGDQEKMSKSLKNTISIGSMLTDYTADEFRMACILSNYRNSVEYGCESMETAKNTLNKFKSFRADCQAYLCGKKHGLDLDANVILKNLSYAKSQMDACIQNDFDTARSICVLLEQISNTSRSINTNSTNTPIAARCLNAVAAVDNFVQRMLRIYGFSFAENNNNAFTANQGVDLNGLLDDILDTRKVIKDRATVNKNKELYQICDELRQCLQRHGIELRDHSRGSSWSLSSTKK